jgi:AAA ATPase domain
MRDAVVTQPAAPIRSVVASARRRRFVVGAAMSRRSRRPAWHRLGETPRIGRRAATVIGRREPLQRIARLFEAARHGQAGALVVVGEAGIGKTSLLDHVDAGADGFQRLRVRGVESEAALDNAGLLQLLTPVRHHLDGVPTPQRRALEAAVGWGPRTATDDRYLVAAGTLSLLATAAETAPVVVMVDDLHWLDPGSAIAVLFAARRLVRDGVAVLLATRHGSPPGTSLDGLDHLTLDGLDIRDAAALLPPGTAPAVVSRLVEATHGNPLALIEIAERLKPAQRRGTAALPDPLPTGGRLEAVYEPVLASLPAASRHAVLLAAASRDGAADPVVRRSGRSTTTQTWHSVTPNAVACFRGSQGSCDSVTRCCGRRRGPRDTCGAPRSARRACRSSARLSVASPDLASRRGGHDAQRHPPPSSKRSPTRTQAGLVMPLRLLRSSAPRGCPTIPQ